MRPGDVVFFQKAKDSSKRKAPEVKFMGHAFGVLLGYVPPFQKDPPFDHVMRLMGTIGYMTFDDIGEFFGPEIGADAVKKFEEKYYGKVVDPNQAELPLESAAEEPEESDDAGVETATAPRLVDANGAPLESGHRHDG